jgi:hypothetical protein
MPSSPHAQANPTAVRPQSSGNELLAVPKRHVLADRVLCATPYERQHRRWFADRRNRQHWADERKRQRAQMNMRVHMYIIALLLLWAVAGYVFFVRP